MELLTLKALRSWYGLSVVQFQFSFWSCPFELSSLIIDMLFLSKGNLTTLDLASNEITRIQNVSHLNKLEEFWVCWKHVGNNYVVNKAHYCCK